MIRHLKHSQIDFDLYDTCVRQSSFPTLYAASWYLDIVTGNDWELLVVGNYEAVMPLPYGRARQTFLRRRIMQPMFCQQLGVFAKTDVSEHIPQELLTTFFKLQPFTYHFNHANAIFLKDFEALKSRTNLVLPLNQSPEIIKNGFSTNLRRNIRKAEKAGLDFRMLESDAIPELIRLKKASIRIKLSGKVYKRMVDLMKAAMDRNHGFLCGVFDKDALISSAFILKSYDRLVYLIAAKSEAAEKNGAAHFLLYNLIKELSLKHDKLDFEGSDQKGVARFFKSFGSKEENYFAFS